MSLCANSTGNRRFQQPATCGISSGDGRRQQLKDDTERGQCLYRQHIATVGNSTDAVPSPAGAIRARAGRTAACRGLPGEGQLLLLAHHAIACKAASSTSG